ncbi:MAG: hypothetical protein GC154_15810 [bacterium]|nr:hypothetical protein [bacterium]
MSVPNEIQEWVQRMLDGEGDPPAGIAERLAGDEECRGYYESMKRLYDRLEAYVPPDPPASTPGDVMAFIERREREEHQAARREDWLTGWWNSLSTLLPEWGLIPTLRREAWSMAIAAVVLVWGGFVHPMVESGEAQRLVEPLARSMVTLAGRMQETSEKVSDRINRLADDLIDPILNEDGEPSSNDSSRLHDADPRLSARAGRSWDRPLIFV